MDTLTLTLFYNFNNNPPSDTAASKFIFSDISADILCDIDFESLSNYDRLNLGRKQSQIPELAPTNLKTRNWFLGFFAIYWSYTSLLGEIFFKDFSFWFQDFDYYV